MRASRTPHGFARPSRAAATAGHRPFALVLAGGGARGAAHLGVLRALEHDGLRPSAIVGVSMGAIVGATYALNPDWYRAALAVDFSSVPGLTREASQRASARIRSLVASGRALRHLLTRWGSLTAARETVAAILEELTLGKRIEDARIPIAIVATDLNSGRRVVVESGPAATAAYASGALAGVLPPVPYGDALLADGCYADVAPVDVARELGGDRVVVVNPMQYARPLTPRNGLQALMRSMEISLQRHALARFREADLEIQVQYPHHIHTIDFSHHRLCVAAGVRAVRAQRAELAALLRHSESGCDLLRPHAVAMSTDHEPTRAS